MRQVTIYSIKAEQQVVQGPMETLFRRVMDARIYPLPNLPGEAIAPLDVKTISMPIRHIYRYTPPGEREEHLLCLDPELREMFEVEWKEKFEQLRESYAKQIDLLRSDNTCMRNWFENYMSLPWYKRMFRAMRKELLK